MKLLRVLIVEDEAPKLAHLEDVVRKSVAASVKTARSVNSALDAIEAEKPDLLLLDMSLPTFDIGGRESGGRPQGFGGIEILRYMDMEEIYFPVLVVTGYEAFLQEDGKHVDLSEMRADLLGQFPIICKGVLHYNSTYDDWKESLRSMLSMMVQPDEKNS